MKAGNLRLVKNMNNSLVWKYLAKNTQASITDIAKAVGLSFPTVNRALECGIEKGLIIQGEINNSSVGRKPHNYKLNKDFAKIICIAVNKENIKFEIKNFCGEAVESGERINITKNILDDLADIINSAVKKHGLLDLAAISLTGVVSKQVVKNSYLHPELDGINVCDTLFLITGVRTVIENNMRIYGYTTNTFIENAEEKTVSVLRFGEEGIGSCNIIRGRIQRGNEGFAGEVGYIPFGTRDIKKPNIYAKIATSIIAVLAPHELIIYNDKEKIDSFDVISIVKDNLPEYAVPKITLNRNSYEDLMYGIYLMSRGYLMAVAAYEKS